MKLFFQYLIILMVMLVVNDMANATVSIYLEKKDDGITVKLESGDTLVITLDANPTTGYSWHVLEIDDSILKAGKTEFRPQSNLLGAPGKEIMYFTALENGETKLVLGYLRPWEKGIKPLDTFSVTVRVILMLQ
jgi:inhibitor of cysteine peptidase